MNHSVLKGLSFGLTSGIITTLGLIVGLNSFGGSVHVVIGGILTIAVADSFSDALGIHVSEESAKKSCKHVWTTTIVTLVTKMVFASLFIIPFVLFSLQTAVVVSVVYGLSLLSILSYYIARNNHANPLKTILEHVTIAVLVIIVTNYLGRAITAIFN